MRSSKEIVSRVLPSTRPPACSTSVPAYRKLTRLFPKLLLLCVALIVAGSESAAQTRGTGKGSVTATSLKSSKRPATRTNPFSLANIQKTKRRLARTNPRSASSQQMDIATEDEPIEDEPIKDPPPVEEEGDRLYTYLRFDPNGVTGELLQQLEADSTIHIMDFPFANGELYSDEFALDEAKAEQLRDGLLYAVLKKDSPLVNVLLETPKLGTELLDELYLPQEEDTALQLAAFREAGYTEEAVERLRLCLFKRPSGFVRYRDNELGRLEPVRGMQVWGLVFGIPLHTYTDANGHYNFPWRFSAGTIMGTHAKNSRVNVKPLNTHGTVLQVIPQLIANFIFGSIHIRGWVSSCEMRSEVNFHFEEHRQNRYWSQILNAVYFHDLYSQQQGIQSAPTNNLIVYAQWGNTTNRGDFGNASAPMLYHLTGGQFTDAFLGLLFEFSPTGQILSILHGLLPDITLRVTGDYEPPSYEPRLAQIAFHELGHASHYRRVNAGFWLDLMAAEVFHGNDPCGGYGCGGLTDDGNVQVAESWAQYIGVRNALTRYPNGVMRSGFFGNNLVRFDTALEQEAWFVNNWIPSGIYNDLEDGFNTTFEPWDNMGGASVQQLYNVLNSDVDTMCEYQEEFLRLYPGFNPLDVQAIFQAHGIVGCAPVNPGGATHAGMTWTVLQQSPGGVVRVGADGQTNPYSGDTPATANLPVLCLNVDNSGVPAGFVPDFYNGWARGSVALTPPVSGTQLTSPAAADAICSTNFGGGWRMAEFHDGRFGANLSSSGGWSFSAFGALPAGTRFWTAINDQPANPWN